jgi:Uma2 family endonuclease
MTITTTSTANLSTLDLSGLRLTHAQFEQLCEHNRDVRLELTAEGYLTTMAPTFGESSKRNFDLIVQLGIWNRKTQLGESFESSGGFILPNGATRSPDVSWVEKSRLENITLNQFIPLAPDFVIELRSTTDKLPPLQAKMSEYRENGVKLGWLINPQDRQVEIYRLNKDREILLSPTQLSGEDILVGFELDLTTIW